MTKKIYTEEQLLKIAKQFKRDFPLYAKNLLKVVDKGGNLRPFVLNECQKMVHRAMQQQLQEKGKVRTIVLKARQTGISTYVEGRLFWKTTGYRNKSAFVLSHMQDSTSAIFNMVEGFYNNIPHPGFKPPIKSKTTSTLKFDILESQYRIGTAKTGETGRGQTNTYLHCSEVAFYPDADRIAAGIVQTVGDIEGTEIVLESTANGVGGWFYDRCMESIEGKGEYQLVFIPWFQMPEYRIKPLEPIVRTDEEDFLAREYGLDDLQLNFRRAKISDLGSEALFRQEYPSNPREAFLTSGRCFVDFRFLDKVGEECYTPDFIGEVGQFGFANHSNGPLKVWWMPESQKQYVIGVDIAEGLEHGDYTVAQVIDYDGNQVACWRGHIDPGEFGDVLLQLATKYNRAYIVPERNNHGLTTIHRLLDRGYPHLYMEQVQDHAWDKPTKKVGWLTTTKTKPLMIDNLANVIRTEPHRFADKELVDELRTYVIDEKGRTSSQRGCFDDRIVAIALAHMGLKTKPQRRSYSPTVYKPADSLAGY